MLTTLQCQMSVFVCLCVSFLYVCVCGGGLKTDQIIKSRSEGFDQRKYQKYYAFPNGVA